MSSRRYKFRKHLLKKIRNKQYGGSKASDVVIKAVKTGCNLDTNHLKVKLPNNISSIDGISYNTTGGGINNLKMKVFKQSGGEHTERLDKIPDFLKDNLEAVEPSKPDDFTPNINMPDPAFCPNLDTDDSNVSPLVSELNENVEANVNGFPAVGINPSTHSIFPDNRIVTEAPQVLSNTMVPITQNLETIDSVDPNGTAAPPQQEFWSLDKISQSLNQPFFTSSDVTTSMAPDVATDSMVASDVTTPIAASGVTDPMAPAGITTPMASSDVTTPMASSDVTTPMAPADVTTPMAPADVTTPMAAPNVTTQTGGKKVSKKKYLRLTKNTKKRKRGGKRKNNIKKQTKKYKRYNKKVRRNVSKKKKTLKKNKKNRK